jgi:hypothetical protein
VAPLSRAVDESTKAYCPGATNSSLVSRVFHPSGITVARKGTTSKPMTIAALTQKGPVY